jgi:DNA-binding ferritin-like protein
VLSTQNPVDLDYKGLSNIGTWFIGRLQTTQDIERVIDGLGGKVGSSYEKKEIKTLLANLKKRTFFLKSAHLEDIRLFTTRWVLSYLKGPLKRQEIAALMADQKQQAPAREESVDRRHVASNTQMQTLQPIDVSIPQFFEPDPTAENRYIPSLGAKAKVHFYQQRRGIDMEREQEIHLMLDEDMDHLDWDEADKEMLQFDKYPKKAPSKATFAPLPQIILSDKGLKKAARELKEHLYRTEAIELYRCMKPKLESKVGESRTDFTVRLQDLLNEKKEQEIDKLQERYAKKEQTILERLQRAQARVEKEEADSTSSMIEAGIAVLGALFGRASSTKIGRVVSKGSRILKERGDMSRAQERVAQLEEALEALEYELEEKIDEINEKYSIDNCEIETFKIKPRKTDIDVELMGIVWRVS